jgi:SAM-dependent methyltransferase
MSDQVTGLFSPFLRNRRLSAARRYIRSGRILDLGCGTGNLAQYVDADRYLGVDLDPASIDAARRLHPKHCFLTIGEFEKTPSAEPFHAIVALAVVEHISDPVAWLAGLRPHLHADGTIVLTTPHPAFGWAHALGARLGIFSREAADEHETLINSARMREIAHRAGFELAGQRRFLGGANQLFILRQVPPTPDTQVGGAERDDLTDREPIRSKNAHSGVNSIRWMHHAGHVLAVAAGIAVLWPLAIHGRRVWESAHGGSLLAAIGVGAVVYAVLSGLLAFAWWWLLGVYNQRPRAAAGLAVWARTQIAKYVPGNVFHYVGRHALGRGVGASHAALAAAALLELVSLLIAAVIVQAAGSIAGGAESRRFVSFPAALVLAAAAVLGWPLLDRGLRRVPLLRRRMQDLPSLSAGRSVSLLGPSLLLHIAFLLGTGGILFGLVWAGWPGQVRPGEVVSLYALAWTVSTITPGAPGGAGIREGLLTVFLAGSLGSANAAAAAVALRLVTVMGDVLTAGWGWALPLKPQDNQLSAESSRTSIETWPSVPS